MLTAIEFAWNDMVEYAYIYIFDLMMEGFAYGANEVFWFQT